MDLGGSKCDSCTALARSFSSVDNVIDLDPIKFVSWQFTSLEGEQMRSFGLFTVLVAVVGSFASFAGAAFKGTDSDTVVVNPNAPVVTGTSIASSGLVVPVGAESSADSGVNTAIRSAPRTYQEYMAASNFSAITQPSLITGMQLRLAIGENWRPVGYVGSTWPSQNISLATYSVTLSKPSAGLVSDGEYLSTAPTFASYEVSPVNTYNAALNIAAGAFSADGGAVGVHSFGPIINFTTPYAYTPGNGLVMRINHGGYTPSAELNAFFGSRTFQNGVADAISSTTSGTATAPSGFSSPYFVQFIYQDVPEPASLTVLAAAGLLALRRRKA